MSEATNNGSASTEAKEQVQALKHNADDMLLQLMLDQKSKLNDMVQQLRAPQNTSRTSKETNATSQNTKDVPKNDSSPDTLVQNLPPSSQATSQVEREQQNIPLDQVAQLQQDNLNHLDTIVARINETMKSSLSLPSSGEVLKQKVIHNDTKGTDI